MSSLRHVRRGFGSSKFWNGLAVAAGFGALFTQSTSSDRANLAAAVSGWTLAQKLQAYGTAFLQRLSLGNLGIINVTGSTGSVGLNSKPTWNIGNSLNKFTAIGIGAEIYKRLPGLPQRGKIGKFGLPLIVAGLFGGLLDDPVSTGSSGVAPATTGGRSVTTRMQSTTTGWGV